MNGQKALYNRLYRIGYIAGGSIFALSFLEPILSQAAPFIPLIVTVAAGLAAGLLVKAVLNAMVNKKLNQSYRYSANDSDSASPGGHGGKTGQRAEHESPKREAPPAPDVKFMYRKLLGLGESYTAAELKAAYRDCAAKFHPDYYVNASEAARRRAEEMMKNINEAYHALS